jgi:hypothetical protein
MLAPKRPNYSIFTIDEETNGPYSNSTIETELMVSPFPFAQRPVEFIASAERDLAAMPKPRTTDERRVPHN